MNHINEHTAVECAHTFIAELNVCLITYAATGLAVYLFYLKVDLGRELNPT